MKKFILVILTALLVSFPLFRTLSETNDRPQKIIDNVYHLTDQDFDEQIKKGVVLVDFWAVWCGPCRTQGPIVDQIAQEIGQKAKIAKVDVDKARVTATRFNIRYIPTIIIFSDGLPVKRLEGLQQKDIILEAINSI